MDPEEILRRLMGEQTAPSTPAVAAAEEGLGRAVGAIPQTHTVDLGDEPDRITAQEPTDAAAVTGAARAMAQPRRHHATAREQAVDTATSAADAPGLFAEGALPGIMPTVGGVHGVLTGAGYEQGREHGQDLLDAARERSPQTSDIAGTAGLLSGLGISAPARGAGFVARAAGPVGLGATYGLLGSQSGDEDPTTADAAGETALGAAIPLAIESLFHGGGQVARQVARTAPLQRLASVLGELFGAGSSREVDRMVQTIGHGDPERAARVVEDLGVVGPASTVDDVVERSTGALGTAEAATRARRGAFHDAGHRVPAHVLPDALDDVARRMEADPAQAEYAERIRAEAARARSSLQRHHEPPQSAVDALERARTRLAELPPPPGQVEMGGRLEEMERIRQGLIAQGIPEGSDAFQREMRRESRDVLGGPLLHSPDGVLAARQAASDHMTDTYASYRRARPVVPLRQAERALEPVRRRAGFRNITEPQDAQEAMREALGVGRGAIDRVVESTLPTHEAGRFAEERARVQASRMVRDMATRRARMAALRSPLSQMMLPALLATTLGGAGAAGSDEHRVGGGIGGAIAGGLLYRGVRGRDAALRATGARLVQRLVESGTAGRVLGRAGVLLEQAFDRGALPVVHRLLMQQPQYAQQVEQLAADEGGDQSADDFGFVPDEGDDFGFIPDEQDAP